jgi:hypothetical protein
MSIRRRRRKDYTPEQDAARECLHQAETWLQIVSSGIAEALKREHYCFDGIARIINIVNTDLVNASNALDLAQKEHDQAFGRPRRARSTVMIVRRSGKRNPPRAGKSKPSPTVEPKQKRKSA